MNEKLKEFFGFLLCLFLFIYIIEHFDFRNNILNELVLQKSQQTVKNVTPIKYKKYSVSRIPSAVYKGSDYSGVWTNLLYSNKKAVFYIKDDKDTLFNRKLNMILNSNSFANKYVAYDFSASNYKNFKRGAYIPKKICNSLQECNQQRKNASNYTEMVYFFDKCSRTVCIINPMKKQYVILRNKDYREALNAISSLSNW